MSEQNTNNTTEQSSFSFSSKIMNTISYLGGYKTLLIVSITLTIMILGFISVSVDDQAYGANAMSNILYTGVPFLILILYFTYLYHSNENPTKGFVYGYMTIATIFFICTYLYLTLSPGYLSIFTFTMNILTILIAIVGLAILSFIIGSNLRKMTGWTGFIINFIFYIPCMVANFASYLVKEFRMTPPAIAILFMVEIALLLIYFYAPTILKSVDISHGKVILEDSMFLNKHRIITLGNEIRKAPDYDNIQELPEDKLKVENRNYAVSMWIYLNTQGSDSHAYANETNIFNYGGGKPRITYKQVIPDQDPDSLLEFKSGTYRVYFTDANNAPFYELNLPYQKWNNFVFNYTSTHADLFINGHLEKTFYFNSILPPTYAISENIELGSVNGLKGAISNVRYYMEPLTKHQIAIDYNLIAHKKIPSSNI